MIMEDQYGSTDQLMKLHAFRDLASV